MVESKYQEDLDFLTRKTSKSATGQPPPLEAIGMTIDPLNNSFDVTKSKPE